MASSSSTRRLVLLLVGVFALLTLAAVYRRLAASEVQKTLAPAPRQLASPTGQRESKLAALQALASPAPPKPTPPAPVAEIVQILEQSAARPGAVYGVATASVVGNLGPPSSVLSESVADWMTDRWQIAGDLSGTPLPLPQWIAIHFRRGADHPVRVCVDHVLLDWETAFASEYTLEVQDDDTPAGDVSWRPLFAERAGQGAPGQHILHTVTAGQLPAYTGADRCGTSLRLTILRNGAQWGASLWRFLVSGTVTP